MQPILHSRRSLIVRSSMALLLAICASGSLAHSYQLGSITIGHPWAPPTGEGVRVGAAYLKLSNLGAADRLVGASVSPDVADRVEMHSMSLLNDVMSMRQVDVIDVTAGGKVELRPGGLHLMVIGLKKPFSKDARVPIRLHFERAGTVDVELKIEPLKVDAGQGHGHAGH